MAELFLKVVNMSISASYLVLAVVALRFLLKKIPKWVRVLLWGLVALRLLFPFSIESALSLIPSAEVVSPEIMTDPEPTIYTGIEQLNLTVNPVISETFAPEPAASANPLQILIPVLAVIWLIGIGLMLLYTLVSYLRIQRQIKLAIRVNANVYLSENIASPFVLGIFRPKIYLPYGMKELDMYHVIGHERTHIRRKDHWWKPLGFALLTIHWFNPLMWLAYILLCRDIELACDEKVIQKLGAEQRADYSQALLNCSVRHRTIAACPIAFGEVGVKERVKNVLTYRKPAFWIIVIALILCVIVAACFLTDPQAALIDRILQQDGYCILFQTEMQLEMSIPKRDYPAECYTAEGYTFRKGQHVSGSYYGNTYYLKHMGYADESKEYLRFTFGIDYEPQGNTVFLPYSLTMEDGDVIGTESTLSVSGGIIFADEGGFDLACYPGWDGAGQEFYVDIRADVWDYARSGVYFTVHGFQRIFFEKEPLFGEVNPRPITHSLNVEDIEFAQATFWGDSQQHLLLDQEQIGELVYLLNLLPEDDFEESVFPINTISLMINCGDRDILLSTNGSDVYFTFDSETAANIDGDWMTHDEELIRFLTGLSASADYDSFYGVSLTVEEVSPNGATVVFTAEGEAPAGRLLGGNDYWLQMETDGVWQDITKVPEPSFTTEAYDIDNIRRHKIDWQWRYGILSSGHYRIGKSVTYQEGSKALETATVWAEFTLADPAIDAYAILSNLIPDSARAEATFASGGGYNCFPQEAQELVGILNGIEESELVVSPAMTPTLSMTVYAGETVTLHYNGVFVQFAFETDQTETLWAVNNEKLIAFMEQINSYSPENSTYEIYNVAPLEDLPETYTLEEATIDKVVIIMDGDAQYNESVWWEFLEKVRAGTPATVRVMHYHSPGEAQMGYKVIMDLSYDGTEYMLEYYSNNIHQQQSYSYLLYYSGNASSSASYDSYEGYLLTDDPEESAYMVDRLINGDSMQGNSLIFTNLIYIPTQLDSHFLDISSPEKAELKLNGRTLVSVTEYRGVSNIYSLICDAVYMGYEPKTYNLGAELVFTDSDNNVITLYLDLDSDMIQYKGLFYDYGPGTNSNGGVNNLPVLLGMLGLEDWPQEVKDAYPNFFGETSGGAAQPVTNDFLPADEYWSDAYISLWFTDGSQLGFGNPQTLPILESLSYEAPNPTDQEMPGFADCVFSANIAFTAQQQFNIGYVGEDDFFFQVAGTNDVYTFSSEVLRQDFETAISEVRSDESSIFYQG